MGEAHAEFGLSAVGNKDVEIFPVFGNPGYDPAEPPMFYWLASAGVNLFGFNNFAVRLISALAAGLTALLTALLIQQNLRDEKLAALAATITLSCAGIIFAGAQALPAMLFVMAVTGSLGTIFLALQEVNFNRRKFTLSIIAGLFIALALLTGGLKGIIFPLLVTVPYMLFSRKFKEHFGMPPKKYRLKHKGSQPERSSDKKQTAENKRKIKE